ncbi:AMIN-like domain-containing (lipo)protein [Corynebacterium bouchesdurhonense]|uniref:AMIN-like domain-containing (lipo)protein n=1 Tax=Corynebacterium bouchesdurhonense TaxID=1720192 RepID=UPI000835D0CB|nr:hypothetical protein [Corynebacterium bouchesdurhonense]
MLNRNARSRAAAAAALVALGVAGCDAGADGAGAPVMASVSGVSGVSGGSGGSSTALRPLGTADAAAKTQRPSEPAQLAVAGVRVGNHEGFDRVVLDLVGDGEPGWFVDYTPTPMRATVGKALPVSGNAFLSINVDGTVYPFELGLDSEVPVESAGNTGNIVDVVHGGTHEGRSQVVVGLRSETPYSVQVLQDPKRLVVDILQA